MNKKDVLDWILNGDDGVYEVSIDRGNVVRTIFKSNVCKPLTVKQIKLLASKIKNNFEDVLEEGEK